MFGQIIEQAGIPILIGLVCAFFAYRVMVHKDLKAIRGKNKPDPKNKDGYCREAGRILLFFAAGSFIMGILSMISSTAALIESLVCVVITMVLWKKMSEKYD